MPHGLVQTKLNRIMNNTEKELLLKIFKSLPEDQDGKKLKGIKFEVPQVGDVRLTLLGIWAEMMSTQSIKDPRPIAIYEDTHRADGTPMTLPEPPLIGGRRLEFFGASLTQEEMGDACGYAYYSDQFGKWYVHADDKGAEGHADLHYARLFKIAKPTTREDLVGDGQKIVWLHWESSKCDNGTAASQVLILVNSNGINVDGESMEYIISKSYRWSHSPATPYADATPFKA